MTNQSTLPQRPEAPLVNGVHKPAVATIENIASLLAHDTKVKVAGVDCDGILRGKVMSKEKFLSTAAKGFAMSSAIFGWDMHDEMYTTETKISTKQEGYSDFIAIPDLSTYRRLPLEDNMPFFLVSFRANGMPVSACGRSILRTLCQTLRDEGVEAKAGGKPSFFSPLIDTRSGCRY